MGRRARCRDSDTVTTDDLDRRATLHARLVGLQTEHCAIVEALARTPLSDLDGIRALAARLRAFNESLTTLALELESLHDELRTQ